MLFIINEKNGIKSKEKILHQKRVIQQVIPGNQRRK